MLASELITQLNELIKEQGDKEIYVFDYDQREDSFIEVPTSHVCPMFLGRNNHNPEAKTVFIIN